MYLTLKLLNTINTEINLTERKLEQLSEKLPANPVNDRDFELKKKISSIRTYKEYLLERRQPFVDEAKKWMNTCNMYNSLKEVVKYYYIDNNSKQDTIQKYPHHSNFLREVAKYGRGF